MHVLAPLPKPPRPASRPTILTTRTIALAYLPTVGLWSLIQAIRFYRKGWRDAALQRLIAIRGGEYVKELPT